MSYLFGIILVVYSCSTYVVIKQWLQKNKWTTPKATIVALVVIVGLWYLQGQIRHEFSAEAQAMNVLNELRIEWEKGNHELVNRKLENLATTVQPWDKDSVENDFF